MNGAGFAKANGKIMVGQQVVGTLVIFTKNQFLQEQIQPN